MSLQPPHPPAAAARSRPALDTTAPAPVRTASQYTVTALTPGPDFPGAYPRSSDPLQSALDPTNAALDGLLDAARQYIPGQDDVGKVLFQAAQVAGQYLPQAVTSYFPATQAEKQKRDSEISQDREPAGTPRVEVTPAESSTATPGKTNTSTAENTTPTSTALMASLHPTNLPTRAPSPPILCPPAHSPLPPRPQA
ncbi:hypothetical protein BD779DRAFT_221390 [Infundibulicybe gibba]|nr:hypothetical protein BD779DRAFT_221390 [Infundibulicybe gibba]